MSHRHTETMSDLVDAIAAAVHASGDNTVPVLRRVRRQASKRIRKLAPDDVIGLGAELMASRRVPRWFVYELVHHHRGTMSMLSRADLERLGDGMSAWDEVDPFGCYLSGVAWREGQVDDDAIHTWARSDDRWWRRAALVSTVALNSSARGGTGDPDRTIAVCEILKEDRDDMVVKAMSWALRELSKKEPDVVRAFVGENENVLAARVLREVRNKLETGLKNPK